MRIAEDRNMENYGNLQKTLKSENIYQELTKIFSKSNDKYNSGLFKIEKWLDKLEIDNKIIKHHIAISDHGRKKRYSKILDVFFHP